MTRTDTVGTVQPDAPVSEIDIRVGQIEIQVQRLGHEQNSHVPHAFLGEGLGITRHVRRQVRAHEPGQVKCAILLQRDDDGRVGAGAREGGSHGADLRDRLVQVHTPYSGSSSDLLERTRCHFAVGL